MAGNSARVKRLQLRVDELNDRIADLESAMADLLTEKSLEQDDLANATAAEESVTPVSEPVDAGAGSAQKRARATKKAAPAPPTAPGQ